MIKNLKVIKGVFFLVERGVMRIPLGEFGSLIEETCLIRHPIFLAFCPSFYKVMRISLKIKNTF